jgi:hypothetical protein
MHEQFTNVPESSASDWLQPAKHALKYETPFEPQTGANVPTVEHAQSMLQGEEKFPCETVMASNGAM